MSDAEYITFRKKALASLGATAGMFLLPAAYLQLEIYGPSNRVQFYGYLFPPNAENYPLSVVLGAWLGAKVYRLLSSETRYSVAWLATGCLLGGGFGVAADVVMGIAFGMFASSGAWNPDITVFFAGIILVPAACAWLGGIFLFKSTESAPGQERFPWLQPSIVFLVIIWLLIPQLMAFPKDGTLAERDAWTRVHVPQYVSLAHAVEKIPIVVESVGRIISIAPTADDNHIAAIDMDGVGMNFTLDVVGETGQGVLHANCIIDGGIVYRWDSGAWTFKGQTTEVTTIPDLPPLRR